MSSDSKRKRSVELHAERLVAGGAALCALPDGGRAFVTGALPGERFRARLSAGPGGTERGAATEILEPARERIEPDCDRAGQCGGCDWLHVEAAAALRFKGEIVTECLSRAGLDSTPEPRLHPSPRGRAARARVRLHLAPDGSVGYMAARSRRVVPVTACPALRPELSDLLPVLSGCGRQAPPGPVRGLLAARDDDGRTTAVLLDKKGKPADPSWRQAKALRRALKRAGVLCTGPGVTTEPLRFDGVGPDVTVPPASFFQANPEANRALVERLLELAGPGPGRAVDAYCGAGNLGLPLAAAGWTVTGWDRDPHAVAHADERARGLGLQGKFGVVDLDEPPGIDAELLVLDPPRRGARALVGALDPAVVRRVLYVACDPACLARDAAQLSEAGYRLTALDVFDFFPGTHHVETLASFTAEP